MTHYLIKFVFYTAGVIGFMLVAYVIAKHCLAGTMSFRKRTGNLEIEETLQISQRKTLHIIKAFNERFLIASDASSTTLLAKLNDQGEITEEIKEEFSELLEEKPAKQKSLTSKKTSVIQSMLEKLNNN